MGASAATTDPWSLTRRTTAGDLDQVQAEPTPPAEPPGVAPAPVPPLSAPPVITARAAVTSPCRPAVAVRSGVMSGSVRSTTTAVLHRGHRYAPDAPHQLRSQRGLKVTEDMDPADAERYVFKRFRYRLPEVLQELYFVATKEGKIRTLKEANKWLNEQERVVALQVAAKRWKAIKLQHHGREIRLRDSPDFRGQYTLFRRNVEDWNEGDEQASLLHMLSEAWIKRVTKEEANRAKSNHTVKMMLPKEYHTNVVAWTRKNVTRDVKRHSLRNALLITVTGDREKTAMWRLDECDVGGQTIRLQAIPAQMSCDDVLECVGEEVLKEYRNLHHTGGLRPGDRDVNYVGEGLAGKLPWTQREPMAMRLSTTMTATMSPSKWPFVPSWPTT